MNRSTVTTPPSHPKTGTPRKPARDASALLLATLGGALVSPSSSVLAKEASRTPLTLGQFLQQVKENSPGFKGSLETSLASEKRASEGGLAFSPILSTTLQLGSDARLQPFPLFTYDRIIGNVFNIGVAQQTRFGLQAKLSYNVLYTSYVNVVSAFTSGSGGAAIPLSFHDTTPKLELSQSFWGNGFGRSARASEEIAGSAARAQSLGTRFQARANLVQAEGAYWRLVAARKAVSISKGALERAQKIYDWMNRRVNLRLGDPSDRYQAEAALKLRKLEYQGALDELHVAELGFNTARFVKNDRVEEALPEITTEAIEKMSPPVRASFRDDVKASQEQEKLTRAQAIVGEERNKPTLDVFASYALNGRADGLTNALSDPFAAGRPTQAIGFRFQAPLDLGTVSDARSAWRREQAAAALAVDQKIFEQERSWKDLQERLGDSQRKLKLIRALESVQDAKVNHERNRLQQGRSTTFQVLQFEQEYAQAQLTRIRAEAEILGLITQMKLFSEEAL
jgi:outer membrane protein TolC